MRISNKKFMMMNRIFIIIIIIYLVSAAAVKTEHFPVKKTLKKWAIASCNEFAKWSVKMPLLAVFWPDSGSGGVKELAQAFGISENDNFSLMLLENEQLTGTNNDEADETEKDDEEKSVDSDSQPVKDVFLPEVSGNVYTKQQLCSFDFVEKNFYTVTDATYLLESDMPLEKMYSENMSIEGSNETPQILIYHTHSQEKFADSTDDNMTIVQVGDYLEELLIKMGYNVIHNREEFDVTDGKLDRNNAYEKARNGISRVLEENPTVEVVLDIHRDGVGNDVNLITKINGKDTAQIMFFNGISRLSDLGDIDYLENPYLQTNLALSLQLKILAEKYYPDFTRKNYINAYKYNLDLRPKSMLIEVGAQNNTFQEAKNAMEPLAALLNHVFK